MNDFSLKGFRDTKVFSFLSNPVLTDPIVSKRTDSILEVTQKINNKQVVVKYSPSEQVVLNPLQELIYLLIRSKMHLNKITQCMEFAFQIEEFKELFGRTDTNEKLLKAFKTVADSLTSLKILIEVAGEDQKPEYAFIVAFPKVCLKENQITGTSSPEVSYYLRTLQETHIPKIWLDTRNLKAYPWSLKIYEYCAVQFKMNTNKVNQGFRFESLLRRLNIRKGDGNYSRQKNRVSKFLTGYFTTKQKTPVYVNEKKIIKECLLKETDLIFIAFPDENKDLGLFLEAKKEQKQKRKGETIKKARAKQKAEKQTKDKPVTKSPKEIEEERKLRAAII